LSAHCRPPWPSLDALIARDATKQTSRCDASVRNSQIIAIQVRSLQVAAKNGAVLHVIKTLPEECPLLGRDSVCGIGSVRQTSASLQGPLPSARPSDHTFHRNGPKVSARLG
jgi:hypothetical protein